MTKDTSMFADWLLEREARGRAKGVRSVLLIVGRQRFGEPEPDLLAALESIPSAEVLKQIAEHLLEVANWEELMASTSNSLPTID